MPETTLSALALIAKTPGPAGAPARAELVRRCDRLIRAVCRSLGLPSTPDAEAHRGAIAALLTGIEHYDPRIDGSFRGFIVPLVRAGVTIATGTFALPMPFSTERDGSDPEHSVLTTEVRAAVRSFVRALPTPMRRLAVDVYWADRPQREIAAELEVTPAAVTQRLQTIYRRGRSQLAEYRGAVA